MKSRIGDPICLQPLESRNLMSADLSVAAINVTPVVLATNETVPATLTIANNGDSAAPAGVSLRVVFSRDEVFGNGDDWLLPTYKTQAALAPGASTTIQMNSRASGQGIGSYRIGAFVDGYNRVAESNEKNNVRFSPANTVSYYESIASHAITGTTRNDRIVISQQQGRALVNVNGKLFGSKLIWLTQLNVNALAGHDRIVATADFPLSLVVNGGNGNDIIIGGNAKDLLSGSNGRDQIYGGAGNDTISGGNHDDFLFGEAGNDNISGGGGNDSPDAGAGTNTLSGGAGNDRFFASANSASDILGGGDGNDTADSDASDVLDRIEN